MEIPEVWMAAQASVQAQLDQEVLAEAADLAQAQWSDMTLAARFSEAQGGWVDLAVSSVRVVGVLTHVSASGEFILLSGHTLIRVSCIDLARGLPRGLAPVAEALARTRIGFREGSWLREQWGKQVRIRTQGATLPGPGEAPELLGRVAAVGRDFIELDNGGGLEQRLVIALGSVISLRVVV